MSLFFNPIDVLTNIKNGENQDKYSIFMQLISMKKISVLSTVQ